MNAIMKRAFCTLASLAAPLLVVSAAFADPLPGRDILKFAQEPMNGTLLPGPQGTVQPYFGHDELSTAWFAQGAGQSSAYRGALMADDFADKSTSPVVRVRWWGSYLNGPFEGVDKFLISFASDVPAGPATNPYSQPGNEILSQVVTRGPIARGSGTFTEQVAHPFSVDGPIYEYNAELHLGQEFHQQPDTVYWLTIAALVENPALRWGWHNRDYTAQNTLASVVPDVAPGERFIPLDQGRSGAWHFQDDAVSGSLVLDVRNGALRQMSARGYVPERYQSPADGPVRLLEERGGGVSMDLAFELYTVPEPASVYLFAIGLILAAAGQRNRLANY